MNRRVFVAICASILAAFSYLSTEARADKPAVFTGLVDGVGAGGYDVVAYFTEAKPLKGDQAITATKDGVIYRFATAANRDAFVAAPKKYLPQYGGYCAWAVASGYTAKGDPEAWSVVGGKLYLNYSRSVRSQWQRDVAGNIAKGDANWPKVLE